jgi:hypothetical protein
MEREEKRMEEREKRREEDCRSQGSISLPPPESISPGYVLQVVPKQEFNQNFVHRDF